MDDFLNLVRLLFQCSRIWCFGNFTVPKKRIKSLKLQFKTSDFIKTLLTLCAMILILGTNFYLMQKNSKQSTNRKISFTGIFVRLLSLSAIIKVLANLFIEFKFRGNIWFIISSLCDFDIVVN